MCCDDMSIAASSIHPSVGRPCDMSKAIRLCTCSFFDRFVTYYIIRASDQLPHSPSYKKARSILFATPSHQSSKAYSSSSILLHKIYLLLARLKRQHSQYNGEPWRCHPPPDRVPPRGSRPLRGRREVHRRAPQRGGGPPCEAHRAPRRAWRYAATYSTPSSKQ